MGIFFNNQLKIYLFSVKLIYRMEVKQAKETSLKGTEPLITVPNPRNHQQQNSIASAARLSTNNQNKPTKDTTTNSISSGGPTDSKYAQLLTVIEELNREVRPSYGGSRGAAERLKRGIVHAKILVRECIIECDKIARQWVLEIFIFITHELPQYLV